MVDYHVFSLSDSPDGPASVTDHGVVLKADDVPWVSKQLWAPDAATKNGKFYLFFPARDKEGIFLIGVAVGDTPEGPFTPQPENIPGSFSIDPASFVDDDEEQSAYLYFGGIWGGQLQCWEKPGVFNANLLGSQEREGDVPALSPRVAELSVDMLSFSEDVKGILILDPETCEPIKASDHARQFFEAAWMHKYNGKYYFSYSTGDTHYLAYAIGESPYGPFVYAGRILEPVVGWTTHHSVVEYRGRRWLFYHDASLSEGKNHLRCVKARDLVYDVEGNMSLKVPWTAEGVETVGRLEDV